VAQPGAPGGCRATRRAVLGRGRRVVLCRPAQQRHGAHRAAGHEQRHRAKRGRCYLCGDVLQLGFAKGGRRLQPIWLRRHAKEGRKLFPAGSGALPPFTHGEPRSCALDRGDGRVRVNFAGVSRQQGEIGYLVPRRVREPAAHVPPGDAAAREAPPPVRRSGDGRRDEERDRADAGDGVHGPRVALRPAAQRNRGARRGDFAADPARHRARAALPARGGPVHRARRPQGAERARPHPFTSPPRARPPRAWPPARTRARRAGADGAGGRCWSTPSSTPRLRTLG